MNTFIPYWRTRTCRRTVRVGLVLILFRMLLPLADARGESIINTVHNLSANGPGTIRAATANDACVFCHTAHHSNGEKPLWNHNMSSVSNYVVYSSARLETLNVTVPQPNGSSRLCLSCHDGTVALGSVSSGATSITMQNGVTTMPAGVNNLGTDLSADHPVSFVYDSALAGRDPEIKDPSQLNGTKVHLDSLGQLQCTACHDPHDDQFGNFLVMDNTGSALCLTCHQPTSWPSSAHAISSVPSPNAIVSATTQSAGTSATAKATTIAAEGCENCHVSHQAGTKQSLLRETTPEQNCFVCHNGTTVAGNLEAEFQKASIHPITLNSDSHTPVEDPVNPPERHVVCVDCHNPHAANNTTAVAPNASGALAGVIGVTASGSIIQPVQKQYELCFRCHADSIARGPATVSRQFPETNTRLQFAAGNQSFHPIEAIGKNATSVPSLLAPWTSTSLMYCTDCHNNDSGPNAGGTGPNGPHGSIYAPILERNLVFTDYQPESPAAYALCYKCHDRNSLLANQSFPFHKSHIVDDQTACTTCHDSHGVVNSPHLINFNTTYVTPSTSGQLQYISTGILHGNCTLTCHGVDHEAASTSY